MSRWKAVGPIAVEFDDGDPRDHDSFQAPQRRAFNGLCLAIVQETLAKMAVGTLRCGS